MKQYFRWLILPTLFLCFPAILLATPSEDEDFGFWSQNDIEAKLSKPWKLRVGEELRFREHAGIGYYDTHAGLSHQTFSHLLLGGDYLQVRQTRTRGRKDIWYWESRPRIYATLQQTLKGFLFEDRNLLEFRFKQDTDDTVRYRNMVNIVSPWKWTRFEFQPYAANEIFIETTRNGVVEDRLYSGLKLHWWGPVYGAVFYLRQSTKNSQAKWKDQNIFGLSLKITLP